jgi:hypothetical protein
MTPTAMMAEDERAMRAFSERQKALAADALLSLGTLIVGLQMELDDPAYLVRHLR